MRILQSTFTLSSQWVALLMLCSSITFGQGKPGGTFSLTGQLANPSVRTVYLLDEANRVVDSARVAGTRFTLKGKLAEPNLYFIRLDTASLTYPIFLENSPIQVTFSKNEKYQVIGSALHKQWEQHDVGFIQPTRNQLIKLSGEMNKATQRGDSLTFKALLKKNDSVSIYYGTHQRDFLAKKPYTFFNLYLLRRADMEDAYLVNMLTEFRSQLGAYPTFQSLEREIKTRAAQRDQVKPGTQAFDFILPDSSGTDHRLSAHKKTVVLLDFWASWCGPCIVQFPALKALHTAYSNRGLTIIGISIDDDRRRWVQALRKQNPPGLQLLATQNQAIKDNYAVFGIPHLCLIDEHGNVITNDLEGAALQQKIAQLLGDKP